MEYLFVYGTLLSSIDTPMSVFLMGNSENVGKGSVLAKLYDLGNYPGIVLSNIKTDKVYGQVIKVLNPLPIFKELDNYEGVGTHFRSPNLYKRELIDVLLDSDTTIKCWVYIYNLPVEPSSFIASGNYLDYLLGR